LSGIEMEVGLNVLLMEMKLELELVKLVMLSLVKERINKQRTPCCCCDRALSW
jgi:hypothetical protein